MDNQHDRFIMALYYAYGRKDAVVNLQPSQRVEVEVDPLRFAEFYSEQWAAFCTGQASFCPSVQDAWDTFRRSNRS